MPDARPSRPGPGQVPQALEVPSRTTRTPAGHRPGGSAPAGDRAGLPGPASFPSGVRRGRGPGAGAAAARRSAPRRHRRRSGRSCRLERRRPPVARPQSLGKPGTLGRIDLPGSTGPGGVAMAEPRAAPITTEEAVPPAVRSGAGGRMRTVPSRQLRRLAIKRRTRILTRVGHGPRRRCRRRPRRRPCAATWRLLRPQTSAIPQSEPKRLEVARTLNRPSTPGWWRCR